MEEDIKIVEDIITALDRHLKNYEKSKCLTATYHKLFKEKKALENILIDYKQKLNALDKNENLIKKLGKEIDNSYNTVVKLAIENTKLKYDLFRSISKEKVMKRIKQLNKEIEKFKEYVADSIGEEKQFYKKYLGQFVNTRNELQELLKNEGE